MNKALIIIAHGSNRTSSNDEMQELCRRIECSVSSQFDTVRLAFLEIARPTIREAIESVINQGVKEITVVPYFLSAGNHVVRDIPNEIDKIRADHRQVNIVMTRHIGSLPQIADLVIDAVSTLMEESV